jgi:hypothetical protein
VSKRHALSRNRSKSPSARAAPTTPTLLKLALYITPQPCGRDEIAQLATPHTTMCLQVQPNPNLQRCHFSHHTLTLLQLAPVDHPRTRSSAELGPTGIPTDTYWYNTHNCLSTNNLQHCHFSQHTHPAAAGPCE